MLETILLCAKKNSGSFKNVIYKMCLQIIYLIYLYKQDLVLNKLQWLICHKIKLDQNKKLENRLGKLKIKRRIETNQTTALLWTLKLQEI